MSFFKRIFGQDEQEAAPVSRGQAAPTGPRSFGRKNLVSEGIQAPAASQPDVVEAIDWNTRDPARLRAAIIDRAGPYLGPSLEYLFDNSSLIDKHDRTHGMKALFSADKAERGKALTLLLNWLVTENRHDDLQKVCRRRGQWKHEYTGHFLDEPSVRLQYLCFELVKGALESLDPDSDHAKLIELMRRKETYRKDTSPKILRELLKTLKVYPDGKTADALRGLINDPAFADWRAEIEAAIYDNAPAHGAPQDTALLNRATPPLELPDFGSSHLSKIEILVQHFSDLFEPRLYTEQHDLLLSTFSGPSASWLTEKREIFRPLMSADAELLRRLSSLAKQIESKPEPSAKWMQEARNIFSAIPAATWLELTEKMTATSSLMPPAHTYGEKCGVGSEQYIRTLVLFAHFLPVEQVGPMLVNYALKRCYVTMAGHGITSERLGNACVWVLAAMPDGTGVPYLARISARTKYPKIKAKIDAKLNEAAVAAGISRAALDELTVPTHDLDENGCIRQLLGDGEAIIRVDGSRKVVIDWLGLGGKSLKAPSVAIKADKETLSAVREMAKEVAADLSIQSARLQRLYLEDRRWTAEEWRDRYLDHPLVSRLARSLIWWVDGVDGERVAALADETGKTLCDATGAVVSLDGKSIRLWHPIETTVEAVEAWRDRLEALEIVQPFAQAWREVYALTDAERATGTYSNRWAAHILRQHQAMTLARINGWRVTHRMWVDASNDAPWHLTIPAHGLVADYWVQGAGGDDPEVTDSNAYVYVATDRVQFHKIGVDAIDSAVGPARGEAVLLAEIPPLIFSETMRQVDLLAAVASIAADPNWLDRGQDAAHPSQWGQQADAYWAQTTTANLQESGNRRKAVLQRIVPRLAIADKLGFDDKYLTVEGALHRYRIHLGSGACFRGEMHICIVAKAQSERIWLPFEGDTTLSIIISKALLLAADSQITDPVILQQL